MKSLIKKLQHGHKRIIYLTIILMLINLIICSKIRSSDNDLEVIKNAIKASDQKKIIIALIHNNRTNLSMTAIANEYKNNLLIFYDFNNNILYKHKGDTNWSEAQSADKDYNKAFFEKHMNRPQADLNKSIDTYIKTKIPMIILINADYKGTNELHNYGIQLEQCAKKHNKTIFMIDNSNSKDGISFKTSTSHYCFNIILNSLTWNNCYIIVLASIICFLKFIN